MIRSFKDVKLQMVFDGTCPKGFPSDVFKIVRRKLLALDFAEILDDLRAPPGNGLEPLGRDRKGQHSIRVNDQFRICFYWTADGAEQVEFTDYH